MYLFYYNVKVTAHIFQMQHSRDIFSDDYFVDPLIVAESLRKLASIIEDPNSRHTLSQIDVQDIYDAIEEFLPENKRITHNLNDDVLRYLCIGWWISRTAEGAGTNKKSET